MNNALPYKRLCYIKIIAAIVVVISHLVKDYNLGIFNQLFDFGTYSVALFFFLSGYGLMYSLQNKENYLNNFLKKRIPKVAIPYLISTIVWIIISSIIYPQKELFLLKIFSYYPILPYGWYFVILIYLYLIFYVSYKYCKNIIPTILCISTYYVYCYTINAGEWVYTTTPCFIAGILYANYSSKLKNRLNLNIGIGIILFMLTWRNNILRFLGTDRIIIEKFQPFFYTISALCLVAIIVMLLTKYKLVFLNNPKLKDVSYEIYLAQCIGIPLGNYIVKNYLNEQCNYSFFIPIFISLILVIPFFYINKTIAKLLQ